MIYKIFLFTLGLTLMGCAAKSPREIMAERNASANPRSAAYAADGFMLDYRSPDPRPYRAYDFYYKHCALVSRNPWPVLSEYECTDPE